MIFALLASELFRNAVLAGTIAAVTSSLVGYFVVLRAQAFAAESFLDVSFAGATGAALLGVAPGVGMAVFGLGAAIGLGALGERARERSVEIGMVVSFALGLGVLFLSIHAHAGASHANAGVSILFGSLLSVRPADIELLTGISLLILGGLAVVFRPLLFATIDPEGARARGVPIGLVSTVFLILLAMAATAAAIAAGVLLAPALLIAPAAAATRLERRPARALLLSLGLGIGITACGILLSFLWPWRQPPAGFTISALAAVTYFTSVAATRRGFARGGARVIIEDAVETGPWTSKNGSTRRFASSARDRRSRADSSPST